jgi:hypothetical protein
MELFLVKTFFIRPATTYKMQFFHLQWGEHPIEGNCQKRQCLFGKFYRKPDFLKSMQDRRFACCTFLTKLNRA